MEETIVYLSVDWTSLYSKGLLGMLAGVVGVEGGSLDVKASLSYAGQQHQSALRLCS